MTPARARERGVAGAVPVDRRADPVARGGQVVPGQHHVAGASGVRPAGIDVGKGEGHRVGRAGGRGFTAVLDQEPVQDVLAVLGLDDWIFDRGCIAAGGLVPLAVVAADVPALDFHHGDADAGPGDDEVGFVLGGALDHRYRMQQRRIIGQLAAQDLPYPPLGRPARAELGLGRIAARRHGRILPKPPAVLCRARKVTAAG